MPFWRLHHPDYPSEAAARLVNGELTYPFALPGVRCESCGQTWAGSRPLPFALPEPLRDRAELKHPWPIDAAAHRALRAEVLAELRAAGAAIDGLRPGDRFQPATLDVAAPPDADFLWGPGSVLVADRVKGLLARAPGLIFAPVTLRVGRRAHASRRSKGARGSQVMPDPVSYHELIVMAESGNPPGVDRVIRCASCGRTSFDHERRRLVMSPEMWRGDDVFRLATTLWIVVTDAVRRLLEGLGATNVVFRSIDGAEV
jgi:hypothetical protein